jgi:hypothetical protein
MVSQSGRGPKCVLIKSIVASRPLMLFLPRQRAGADIAALRLLGPEAEVADNVNRSDKIRLPRAEDQIQGEQPNSDITHQQKVASSSDLASLALSILHGDEVPNKTPLLTNGINPGMNESGLPRAFI